MLELHRLNSATCGKVKDRLGKRVAQLHRIPGEIAGNALSLRLICK